MVPYQGSGYTYDYKFANTIKEILNDAKTNGALDIETSTVASSRYVQVQSTQRGHEGLGLSVTLVPYGSASWTSLDDAVVAVVDFTSTQNGYDHAHLQNKHETVYASFGEYTAESGISGDVMSTSQFATYVAAAINAAGIGITASASDSTVSLTNDNHGTEGNVTITATNTGSGSTNTTVSVCLVVLPKAVAEEDQVLCLKIKDFSSTDRTFRVRRFVRFCRQQVCSSSRPCRSSASGSLVHRTFLLSLAHRWIYAKEGHFANLGKQWLVTASSSTVFWQ